MVQWAMGVSLLEHRRSEEICEECMYGTDCDGHENKNIGFWQVKEKEIGN